MTYTCDDCPVLRASAEAESLIYATGARRSLFGTSMTVAMLISALRGKYGCPGASHHMRCPWLYVAEGFSREIAVDDERHGSGIPEIRPPAPGKLPGVFL